MNIKLVASDLDGTIIDRNNKISPQNFKAIKEIHKKNIPFVVCTGKSYSVSQNICKQFRAQYGVFGNGTQIIDLKSGKELLRNTLTKEDLLFVITLAKRYNMHVHLYTDKEVITEKLKYMDLRNFKLKSENCDSKLNFKIVHDTLAYIENNDANVFSAVISTETTKLPEFEQLLSINKNIEYTFINKRGRFKDTIIDKDYEYINISPIHINKNEALTFLGERLNIPKAKMLAIGDNINDLEMVKESGIGVAVNESYDDLKAVAKYVTKATVSEGAFAEAIFKFLKVNK